MQFAVISPIHLFLRFLAGPLEKGLLQFLGTDYSGAGTHRELVDLGRERPPGLTLTGNDLSSPGTTLPGNDLRD